MLEPPVILIIILARHPAIVAGTFLFERLNEILCAAAEREWFSMKTEMYPGIPVKPNGVRCLLGIKQDLCSKANLFPLVKNEKGVPILPFFKLFEFSKMWC